MPAAVLHVGYGAHFVYNAMSVTQGVAPFFCDSHDLLQPIYHVLRVQHPNNYRCNGIRSRFVTELLLGTNGTVNNFRVVTSLSVCILNCFIQYFLRKICHVADDQQSFDSK